jgi:hypothetical protein
MAKKNKVKKERQPRKDFAEKFADKLRATGLGEVDEGELGDDSGRWVNLRIKDTELCFSFDMKGEAIDRIGLYKDKVEVTDHIRVWGN